MTLLGSVLISDGARFENLGGQVVMRRLLFCQNLGVILKKTPLPFLDLKRPFSDWYIRVVQYFHFMFFAILT